MPPPLDYVSHPISPELALVDRELVELVRAGTPRDEPPSQPAADVAENEMTSAVEFLENDAREAMLRMCELSDVNPPRPRGRRLLLTVAVPAALWAEALLLVASIVPFGAL